MKNILLYLIVIPLIVCGCTNRNTPVDKTKLLSDDYRIFQDTPAWELAKAVDDGAEAKIISEIGRNRKLSNYREAVFGKSLLMLAVYNRNYNATKVLLEWGADPNLQDSTGKSALMNAAEIGYGFSKKGNARFLNLLLKNGGDPNAVQNAPGKSRMTPLMLACKWGCLDYVRILVDRAAKINYVNDYGESALFYATISAEPDLVLYLLNKGANFKRVLYKTHYGEDKYISDALREWRFDLSSEAYRKKMVIVDLLKRNGIDYRKTPIPDYILKDYPKEFGEKY